MEGQGKPDLAALIRGAARSASDRAWSLDVLLAACWPGGTDRSEPVGRAWVRAWGPHRVPARLPECACATGGCGVCN